MEVKSALIALLLAFGIAAPIPDFLAGMVLGMGACYGAMLFTPPGDRLTLWATLFTGFMVTLFVAIAHPRISLFSINTLPLQLVMGLAGAMSRWIGGWISAFGKAGIDRARKIPGELRLPGGKE